jgi:hypothetical protein
MTIIHHSAVNGVTGSCHYNPPIINIETKEHGLIDLGLDQRQLRIFLQPACHINTILRFGDEHIMHTRGRPSMALQYFITLPQMKLNGHCLGRYLSLLAKDHIVTVVELPFGDRPPAVANGVC